MSVLFCSVFSKILSISSPEKFKCKIQGYACILEKKTYVKVAVGFVPLQLSMSRRQTIHLTY